MNLKCGGQLVGVLLPWGSLRIKLVVRQAWWLPLSHFVGAEISRVLLCCLVQLLFPGLKKNLYSELQLAGLWILMATLRAQGQVHANQAVSAQPV